jgi:type III pantothenate kinase
MTPNIVVDIGNTRMKWGLCDELAVIEMVSLPFDSPELWAEQLTIWGLQTDLRWALASVNPRMTERFRAWLQESGHSFLAIESYEQLPLSIDVDEPSRVGIDRLLGTLAARTRRPEGEAAITVDVGTAVTVNLLDESGTFRGGAIFPGPRLMGEVLHRQTAALPAMDLHDVPNLMLPGRNTVEAIRAGVAAAVIGGVNTLVMKLAVEHPFPWVFLTGGARGSLACECIQGVAGIQEIPHLTLEGICIAAEAMP